MRHLRPLIASSLALLLAAAAPRPDPSPPEGRAIRIWQPAPGATQVPIWPGTPPGSDPAPGAPEAVLTARTPEALAGGTSEAVFDVTVPTMTIYRPRGRGNGTAVIVFPGGGFNAVVITSEGTEICDWITAHGMNCILSKYRVPGSGHHYDRACDCARTPAVPRALQDAQRTIRLVRARAAALGIDPRRIGVFGFSAGGYLVAQVSNIAAPAYASVDAVDRVSSRPDFAISFYPGHLCRGGRFDPGLTVSRTAPPTFLVQAWDDPVDPICNSTLYARALDAAGVRTEVHLFARGGHAFGLRHPERPTGVWPTLLERWLREEGML